jgi:hypothetical protein
MAPEHQATSRRRALAISLEEVAPEQDVLVRCSPGPDGCDPRGTAAQTIRRTLPVAEAVATRSEAEVEVVAGMNALPFDDPASEVVDDDKPACVRDRVLRSSGVDVHRPDEMPLRRATHNTAARTSPLARSCSRRVAAAASGCGDRDCEEHRRDYERSLHLIKIRRRRCEESHPNGRALAWASVQE